ncbi:MAG: FtsX-like permease family protein [Woeseiaceae bacterium]|nr:FtsX-like permease family protein [Woeseiaceae bacterium]
MEIGPVWRALMRQKSSYILIAMQIAVTMALMVNAIAIIQERSRDMARPTGIDEDNIFILSSVTFDPATDQRALIEEDLIAIRNFPGVRNAMTSNSVPIRGGGWGQSLQTEPGEEIEAISTGVYFADEHGIDTFDVKLIAGRNFLPSEVSWYDWDLDGNRWPDQLIISSALARSLFPDIEPEDAVGKTVYIEVHQPVTIIGVLETLQASWKNWDQVEHAMLVPQRRPSSSVRYVIRTEPGYRDELIPQIESMLAENNRGRIIRNTRTMTDIRHRAYLGDSSMIKLLVFIVSLLTGITCLGIVGLASFSVARRTKQIGTRRALGATRPAILRYFMLENFLISSIGVAGGALLAIGLNVWMVQTFSLTPIDWSIIPLAMLVLWAVGQLAVFGPAHRASRVSPAIATRTA